MNKTQDDTEHVDRPRPPAGGKVIAVLVEIDTDGDPALDPDRVWPENAAEHDDLRRRIVDRLRGGRVRIVNVMSERTMQIALAVHALEEAGMIDLSRLISWDGS
jgi:hypothetical protein